MKPSNPVLTQAISAATLVTVVKAIISVFLAFHVFTFDDKQNDTVNYLIDVGIPVLAIFGGAWWASRKVTPLAAPRDVDGAQLTRADNSPAIGELEHDHQEAIKINQKIDNQADKVQDDRRIERNT